MMRMLGLILIFNFIFTLILGSSALAVTKCATLFSKAQPSAKVQEYIDSTIADLARLRVSVDLTQARGSGHIEFTALSANYISKEKELLNYLLQNEFMTAAELKQRITKNILEAQNQNKLAEKEVERKKNRVKSQIIQVQTSVPGQKMIFNRIEPGSFVLYPDKAPTSSKPPTPVTLTKAFDMMSTLTTQFLWKKILDLAEEKWPGQYKLNPEPSQFPGETHPVNRVSSEEIQIWISALNRLSEIGHPDLAPFISDFKKGDRFVLPTNAQWEFVVRGRGQIHDRYHFGNDAKDLNNYAWTKENSLGRPHPVAEKLPLIIDGKEFFDLHGNVWEIMKDNFTSLQKGGTDPFVNDSEGHSPALRGGSWYNNNETAQTSIVSPGSRDMGGIDTGFRLIREVQP